MSIIDFYVSPLQLFLFYSCFSFCGKIMSESLWVVEFECGKFGGKLFLWQKNECQFLDWCSERVYGSFLWDLMDLDWFFFFSTVSTAAGAELINSGFWLFIQKWKANYITKIAEGRKEYFESGKNRFRGKSFHVISTWLT